MGSRKQLTLFQMGGWKTGEDRGQAEGPGPQQQSHQLWTSNSRGRGAIAGRGRNAASSSSSGRMNSDSSGDGRGRGKKAGRGRGRGKGKNNNSLRYSDSVVCLDEEDDLCQQALQQCELAESEIAQAFQAGQNDENIPGFNRVAGETWIYPTNRTVRDYQFNITRTALFHNTLVSLPTGLGKTFIAAVVMFNFHRWYPNDLIIFMAPTRPLVKQQLDACHDIVGINPELTVELTGKSMPNKREVEWCRRKVFFLTPQVLQSDLERNSCAAEKVRCIVVDEAHKAVGNHSYAQVISTIVKVNKRFRVLALSATPGNDVQSIQEVLKNLLISRVELRTEQSMDVQRYIHTKSVETVVVKLDPYQLSIYERVKDVFQVYTGKLMQKKILKRNSQYLAPFQLLSERDKFRSNQHSNIPQHERGFAEATFTVCISLAKAMEYLTNHGLRSFYGFLYSLITREKGSPVVASELKKQGVVSLLEEVKEKLNISVENSSFNVSASGLFDTLNESETEPTVLHTAASGNIEDYLQSHPKMKVLKEIVEKHFEEYTMRSESTRVMIFSQFRDSVQEIGNLLNLLRPRVKPMVFTGQAKTAGAGGRGLKQKEQIQVVEKFKEGDFNVLVATSVGEEGLDIGEVDLIICFDSNKSPTRNIQRMGRTGRQRKGKIIFLLTEGREEKMYYESLRKQSSISNRITDPEKLRPFLFPVSPRMIPAGLKPECFKMNVILSSEQHAGMPKGYHEGRNDSDDEPVEETFDDSDFLRPMKAGKARKKGGGQKLGVKSKLGEQAPRETNTLKQCFEIMELKRLERAKTETIVLSEDEGDFMPTNSPPVAYIGEDRNGGVGDYDMLSSLFDIQEPNASSSVPPCTFVPVKRMTFSWKPEYLAIRNVEDVILKKDQLECIREVVDSIICGGALGRYCECGNIGSSKMDEQENFIDDFDSPMTSSWEQPPMARSPSKTPLNTIQDVANSNDVSVTQPKVPVTSAVASKPVTPFSVRTFNTSTPILPTLKSATDSDVTQMKREEDEVFDDDFEDCLALDANDPFLDYDWTSELDSPVTSECPDTVTSKTPIFGDGDFKTTRKCTNLVITPVAKDNSTCPDVIPCSDDDSSTASESEFHVREDKFSKNFQFKSKSEQHFANFKQKCNAKFQAFPVFRIGPPATQPGAQSSLSSRITTNAPAATIQLETSPSQSLLSATIPSPVSITSARPSFTASKKLFRSSPEVGSRKSFSFKKVPSVKRPADSDAANQKSPEASQSLLHSDFTISKNHTADSSLAAVECVPASSSEDEGARPVENKPDESGCDSDATDWDPEELPPSPVLCRSQTCRDSPITAICDSSAKVETSPNSTLPPYSSQTKPMLPAAVKDVASTSGSGSSFSTRTLSFRSKFTHRLTGAHGQESQDVARMGSATKSSMTSPSPKRNIEALPSELSPPRAKKLKFTFSSKSKEQRGSPPTERSKYFASPKPTVQQKMRTIFLSPAARASVDKSCVSPLPMSPAASILRTPTPEVDSPDVIVGPKNTKRIVTSEERPSQFRTPRRKPRKRIKNPFVLEEADGTSDDSSGDDRNDFSHTVDSSFVVWGDDDEDEEVVSASQQQAMYLRSVKDVVPVRLGRIENPLPPEERFVDTTDYINDSFCEDDVEYADVGVYTQAMIAAREEVDNERRNGAQPKRRLRARR